MITLNTNTQQRFAQQLPPSTGKDTLINPATEQLFTRLVSTMDQLDQTTIPEAQLEVDTLPDNRPDLKHIKPKLLAGLQAYRQHLDSWFGPTEAPLNERLAHAAGRLRQLVTRVSESNIGQKILGEGNSFRLAEEAHVWLEGEFRHAYQAKPGQIFKL